MQPTTRFLLLSCLWLTACGTPSETQSKQTSPTTKSFAEALKEAVKSPLTGNNTAPVIQALSANPKDRVPKDGQISFTLEAYDQDRDPLKYYWQADKGTLSKREGLDVYWKASPQSGIANIQLTVSDGKGGETKGIVKLVVQPDGQAQVKLIAKEECGNSAKRFVNLYSEAAQ